MCLVLYWNRTVLCTVKKYQLAYGLILVWFCVEMGVVYWKTCTINRVNVKQIWAEKKGSLMFIEFNILATAEATRHQNPSLCSLWLIHNINIGLSQAQDNVLFRVIPMKTSPKEHKEKKQ